MATRRRGSKAEGNLPDRRPAPSARFSGLTVHDAPIARPPGAITALTLATVRHEARAGDADGVAAQAPIDIGHAHHGGSLARIHPDPLYASAGANPSAHASLALRPGICSPALPIREAPLASRPRSSAGGQEPRLTASFERAMLLGRLPPRSIDCRPASRRFAAAQAKKTGAPRRQMSASGALNSRYVRMVSSGRALGNGPVQRRKMVPKVGFEPTPPLRDRILSGAVASI